MEHFGIFSVFVVICLVFKADLVNSEDEYDLVPVYHLSTRGDTFDSAVQTCVNRGGYMPLADKDTLMVELADLAEDLGHTELWVNAKETLYPWQWVAESRSHVERDQGCFLEAALQDFTDGREIRDMTKDLCVTDCKLRGNKLAAILTLEPNRPNYGLCRCGNTLGPPGASNIQWCDKKCPGDPVKEGTTIQEPGWCGEQYQSNSNLKYFRVLDTGAEGNLTWEVASVTDDDLCAGFVFQEYQSPVTGQVDRTYSLRKLNCGQRYNFICFLNDVTSNLCDIFARNGGCYHISSGSDLRSSKSWYDARENCLTSGGDLAYMDQAAAENLQSEGLIRDNVPYWVGLTASHWRWNNSAEPQFKLTAWSSGQPNSASENCLLLNTSRTWTDEPCSATHYYFCILYERRLRTTPVPITRPSTPSTPSTPSVTTIAVPLNPSVTSSGPENSTGSAARNEGSPGIATGAIVGIVVGLVLGIVAIIAVVIVGMMLLKRREEPAPTPKSEEAGQAGLTKNDERDGYVNPAFSNLSRETSREDIGPDGTPEVVSMNL